MPTSLLSTLARSQRWLKYGQRQRLAAAIRCNSSYTGMTEELMRRELPAVFEDFSPQASYRLETALADYLPSTHLAPPLIPPPASLARKLPIAHHLCYFEPSRRSHELLPDGTNPDHSPGNPFTRRMWAGGRITWNQGIPLRLDGSRGVCAEFIRSVNVKGTAPNEKIFIEIERRVAPASAQEVAQCGEIAVSTAYREDSTAAALFTDLQHRVRQRLWRDQEEDFGPCAIVETRNIVFMRMHESLAVAKSSTSRSNLQPQHAPTYLHTAVPSPLLLFRFSALTFNAHAIHLDSTYARNIEGYAHGRLVHGPLSLAFILTILQAQVDRQDKRFIRSFDYRNLAPLYCDEAMTFGGAQTGDDRWSVWTQGPDGGLAIRGTARTETRNAESAL